MCNHAYGLERIRCEECGAHVASRCVDCGYESRYEEHAPGCPLTIQAAEGPNDQDTRTNPTLRW
ncbi:hypothetical protein JCM30394_33190 [Deferrisoma palaeochoriense]